MARTEYRKYLTNVTTNIILTVNKVGRT